MKNFRVLQLICLFNFVYIFCNIFQRPNPKNKYCKNFKILLDNSKYGRDLPKIH